MIPTSRYNHQLLLYIIAGGIFSFLLSLFLLQLFFGLLVILWLTEKNSEKKKAFDTVGLLIIVFFAARLISIIFSPYPEISYQALYKDALFYLGFFAFGFYFRVLSEEEINRVFIFLLISFAVFSITGLIRFNLGAVRRTEAFSSGYTTFSAFLAAGTGLTMAFSKTLFNKRILLFSLLMSLMYTALITSLGRFNIIIAVLFFIVGIILFRINYKSVILIIILTSAFTYLSFLNNSTEAEQRIQQPVQLSDRDIIFEGAQELWKERPLIGFGPRTFREIFPFHHKLADKGVGSWHNDFIQLYFESGIIGLLAFLVLLVVLFYLGAKYLFKYKPENGYILYGIILALAAIILSSLTAGFINSPVLSVYFALLAAMLSALTNTYKGPDNGNKGYINGN